MTAGLSMSLVATMATARIVRVRGTIRIRGVNWQKTSTERSLTMSNTKCVYVGPYAEVEMRRTRKKIDNCAKHNRGDAKFCPECGKSKKARYTTEMNYVKWISEFTNEALTEHVCQESNDGLVNQWTVLPNLRTLDFQHGERDPCPEWEAAIDTKGILVEKEMAWFLAKYDWDAIEKYYGTKVTLHWGVVLYIM